MMCVTVEMAQSSGQIASIVNRNAVPICIEPRLPCARSNLDGT